MIIDTHSHLHSREFDADRGETLARAEAAGVDMIVLIGEDVEDSQRALELANCHPGHFLVSAGVHPHRASAWSAETARRLEDLIQSEPAIVAVGETGLDYHYDFSTREAQHKAFLDQLAIAHRVAKPVVIHCREAYDDTLAILREHYTQAPRPAMPKPMSPSVRDRLAALPTGVMHCFFGTPEQAEAFTALGFYIGLGGGVTFKNATQLHEVVRRVPIERIVLETDSPYMAPTPHRGKRNEPSYLPLVAARIAELKGLTVQDVIRVTHRNALHLFQVNADDPPVIAYPIRRSLYLNLTNRCTNLCVFCDRLGEAHVKGHNLRLQRDPDAAQVIAAVERAGGPSAYEEIVFCGYGEPTLRLPVMLEVARYLKQVTGGACRIRLNTNGHSDLINKRPTVPEMAGLIDCVSVSLNAADKETYDRLCQPFDREHSFEAVKAFIRSAVGVIPEVVASAVAIPGLDLAPIEALARSLGAKFRVREYDTVG
ncbi:MAG: TatD family nuclease-associated radical SAM protein [Candidatus Sumerlaeaceae bacterium]|nr:TatD family nuclease-associated radical SAM protein [Candidatus Sumerlaeaceae bacterium]